MDDESALDVRLRFRFFLRFPFFRKTSVPVFLDRNCELVVVVVVVVVGGGGAGGWRVPPGPVIM